MLETPRKRGASIKKVRRACGIGHLHEPTTASHDRKGQLKICPRELKASQDGGRSSETLLPSPSLPSPLTPPVGKGRRKRGGSYTTSPMAESASLKQDQLAEGRSFKPKSSWELEL